MPAYWRTIKRCSVVRILLLLRTIETQLHCTKSYCFAMKGVTQYCAKPPSIIQIKTDDVIPLDRAHFLSTMTHSPGPIFTDGTTSICCRSRTCWVYSAKYTASFKKVNNFRHDMLTAESTPHSIFKFNRAAICRTGHLWIVEISEFDLIPLGRSTLWCFFSLMKKDGVTRIFSLI